MPDALFLDVPVELGLKLMAVVCSDLPDPEWKCSDQVANEVDGIGLSVSFIDFEGGDGAA